MYSSTPPPFYPSTINTLKNTTWKPSSFYPCSLERSPSQGPSSESCPPLKLTSVSFNPRTGCTQVHPLPFLNPKTMILKLTKFSWDGDESPILIGTESIIDAESVVIKHHNGRSALVTKIQSRGAMVETNYVLESVDTIHEMTL